MNQLASADFNLQLLPHFDLSNHNTLGLTARAQWGAPIDLVQDAEAVAREARERNVRLRVLGGGSNVILHERFDGILALMQIVGHEKLKPNASHTHVVIGAGVNWQSLVEWTLDHDLPGLENLAGIPGTVGAAPVQNIGAYGVELADRFQSLLAYDTQRLEHRQFSRADCEFGYRDSLFKRELGRYIILEVTLALPNRWQRNTEYRGLEALDAASPTQIMDAVLNIRKAKLPDWRQTGNVGSFFHNPIVSEADTAKLHGRYPEMPIFPLLDGRAKLSAAWMVDRCGLKGAQIGAAGISAHHALIVVNHGGASADDIAALAAHVSRKVFDQFGIVLNQEPEWI